jgi:hypothetical protein
MSAISNLPTNKNFLSPLGFTFAIKKTPKVNYFVQAVTLPSVSLGTSDLQTPFIRIPLPGDHIEFGQLTVTFRVDEDMQNYEELLGWIFATGFPDNFAQYKPMSQSANRGGTGTLMSGETQFSDATLMILNSVKQPVVEITFFDMFPIGLSELNFDTKMLDVDYLDATATFVYRKFEIRRVS